MSKHLIGVILGTAAVTLFAAQSSGLLSGGSPLLVSPSSFPFIVLRLIGIPPWLIPLLWGALFVGWHPALLRGEAEVPSRTIALWLATALLSGAYFVVSWRAGVVFEGRLFTELSLAADLVVFGVCSALLRLTRARPSFGRSLGLQVSLFVWVSTYAFPYLGSGVIGRENDIDVGRRALISMSGEGVSAYQQVVNAVGVERTQRALHHSRAQSFPAAAAIRSSS